MQQSFALSCNKVSTMSSTHSCPSTQTSAALDKPRAFKGLWDSFVKTARNVHNKDAMEAGRDSGMSSLHFLLFKVGDDSFDYVMSSVATVLQESPPKSVAILLEAAAPNPTSLAGQESSKFRTRLERRAMVAGLVMRCATLQMNVKALHGRDQRQKCYNMYVLTADTADSEENVFLNSFLFLDHPWIYSPRR